MRVLTLLVTHSERIWSRPQHGNLVVPTSQGLHIQVAHVPREARGLVPHSRSLWSLQAGMARWDTGHSLDAAHRGDPPPHTHTHTLLGEVLSSVELCSHGRRGPAACAGSLALFPAVVCSPGVAACPRCQASPSPPGPRQCSERDCFLCWLLVLSQAHGTKSTLQWLISYVRII